ncbi:MAG TPA: hypothetical protein PKE39_00440 [Ignavibacteria bacterium]|nr:hypothetical protein [Ignavibacteria bacterium]HMQ97463.1 hypothetical protein [Ignavibacteria bacterium]
MQKSVASKYILPFVQWFGLLVLTAIFLDYLLHKFNLLSVGYWLSYPGTLLIILSFLYSLRKRKLIEKGSPKKLLSIHEYFAWAGSILLIVHGGIHFNAILPWLAVIMMIITVASGLTGKFLLKKANENLKAKKKFLEDSGLNSEDAERKLFIDSITVDLMKKWRVVHIPITILFAILAILHIITIIMFIK